MATAIMVTDVKGECHNGVASNCSTDTITTGTIYGSMPDDQTSYSRPQIDDDGYYMDELTIYEEEKTVCRIVAKYVSDTGPDIVLDNSPSIVSGSCTNNSGVYTGLRSDPIVSIDACVRGTELF